MAHDPETIRSITHDLRNLVTAVRGHADLALRELSADDPVREDVAHAVVVTTTIFALLDQLDESEGAAEHVAVDLDASVRSTRRLLDALLPPEVELDLRTRAGPTLVSVSKLRIERIVLNLAFNARDAMVDGGKLSIETREGSDGQAQLVVADTGPGFSPDALEHLFEVGFSTKRESGGTGRGLSAVAQFVDSVGGSVDVESGADGAIVTVSLPTVLPASLFDDSERVADTGDDPAVDGDDPAVEGDDAAAEGDDPAAEGDDPAAENVAGVAEVAAGPEGGAPDPTR